MLNLHLIALYSNTKSDYTINFPLRDLVKGNRYGKRRGKIKELNPTINKKKRKCIMKNYAT